MSASSLKRKLQTELGKLATIHHVKVIPLFNREQYMVEVKATPTGESAPVLFKKLAQNRINPTTLVPVIAAEIKTSRGLNDEQLEEVFLSVDPIVPVVPHAKRRRANGRT